MIMIPLLNLKKDNNMSNKEKITCGKFDNVIFINPTFISKGKERVRIGSVNPNTLKTIKYIPISSNGISIKYKDNIYLLRDFFLQIDKKSLKNLIVLTYKERQLLLDILVDFDVDVKVFELLYPFFKNIKYISNIEKSYNELIHLLNKVNELNIKGKSLVHNLSTKYLFNIERKLRYKNKFDYFFAFAYKGGYQEVFKLKEERKDRVIISFDFNSMYIDGMMGKFMEPKSIKYKKFIYQPNDIETIENGLYKVILKNPRKTFFCSFHPFKYMRMFQSLSFNLEDNQEIELLLFKNEILYYKNFFEKVEFLEGFYNTKTINHPLKEEALKTYKERIEYKNIDDQILNNFSKYKLITMHSSTNPKNFKKIFFTSKEKMVDYLSHEFMFNFPSDITLDEKIYIISKNNYFTFDRVKNGYSVKFIDYKNNKSVYSISAQIIANGRLKMIQTIEKFLQYESVEICYCNIDSLHISIKKDKVDNFLSKYSYMISNKIGDLKIETIANKGYWFDVGRYWLIDYKDVKLFRNTLFNHLGNQETFLKSRIFKRLRKLDNFAYVKTIYLNIYKSFTYNKKITFNDSLDYKNMVRYNFEEIKNFDVACSSINKEILKSNNNKIKLFNKIATVKG